MKLSIRITQNEQGGFIASCPSLPGCTSRGETKDQAKDKLDEAIRGYIAAMSNCVAENVHHELLEV